MKAYMPITLLIVGILIGVPSFAGIHSGRLDANKATLIPEHILSTNSDGYDMVIIAPEMFSDALQPLIAHKNSHGVETFLKTTEEIYLDYGGRDNAEQIKYFIANMKENSGIAYALLVGSIYKLPMRISCVDFEGRDWSLLTDLYYSDLYDSEGIFCSWDSNGNDRFGETGLDDVDLVPDIHIGRLACDSLDEVKVVIDKIIHYETESFGQEWFKNMIFIGGDTFADYPGYEGEEHNQKVMQIMSDFKSMCLWSSKGNFNRRMVAQTFLEGAGFVDCMVHGNVNVLSPDEINSKNYFTRYIRDLLNGYKLPIVFLDACKTAKLDMTYMDLYGVPKIVRILLTIFLSDKQPSCFAWSLVKHEGGGAIASIGQTHSGFSLTDDSGEYWGSDKFTEDFFRAYSENVTLGEMMTHAQISYITEYPFDDLTVEIFILLGDPSLKIGGYP